MPSKTRHILGTFMAAEFEIDQAQQRVGIGKGPSPVIAAPLQATKANDLLP
jgi:hypothetical protein